MDSNRISSLEVVEPLVDWLEKNLFAGRGEAASSPAVVEAARRVFIGLLTKVHARETAELRQAKVDRLLGILEHSPRVGLDLWLAEPTSAEWPLELRQAMVGRAAKGLSDSDTPPALVAQAAMILTGEPKLAIKMAPKLEAMFFRIRSLQTASLRSSSRANSSTNATLSRSDS